MTQTHTHAHNALHEITMAMATFLTWKRALKTSGTGAKMASHMSRAKRVEKVAFSACTAHAQPFSVM